MVVAQHNGSWLKDCFRCSRSSFRTLQLRISLSGCPTEGTHIVFLTTRVTLVLARSSLTGCFPSLPIQLLTGLSYRYYIQLLDSVSFQLTDPLFSTTPWVILCTSLNQIKLRPLAGAGCCQLLGLLHPPIGWMRRMVAVWYGTAALYSRSWGDWELSLHQLSHPYPPCVCVGVCLRGWAGRQQKWVLLAGCCYHIVQILCSPGLGRWDLPIVTGCQIYPGQLFHPRKLWKWNLHFGCQAHRRSSPLIQSFKEIGDYMYSLSVDASIFYVVGVGTGGMITLPCATTCLVQAFHGMRLWEAGSADVHWLLNSPGIALPPQGSERDVNCWNSLQQHRGPGVWMQPLALVSRPPMT